MNELLDAIDNEDLSNITKYIYKSTIKDYYNKNGNPINHSQNLIIRNLKELSDNKLPQYVKAISKIRKLYNKETDKIQLLYKEINETAQKRTEQNKQQKNNELLSYNELIKRIEKDYSINDIERIREYLIKCLLVMYNTRNKDLNAVLIDNSKYNNDYSIYNTDENKNYLILEKNYITYIRNDYKTKNNYGSKINRIDGNNHRIYYALKRLLNEGITDLIPLEKRSNLTRYIKKICYGLTETDILKIVLKEQNTLGEASKISHNRGTALSTLQSNYNINH